MAMFNSYMLYYQSVMMNIWILVEFISGGIRRSRNWMELVIYVNLILEDGAYDMTNMYIMGNLHEFTVT